MFANTRRSEVKKANPELSNGELSKVLSAMWKKAPEDVAEALRKQEAEQWEDYKEKIAEYRKNTDGRKRKNKDKKMRKGIKRNADPGRKNLKKKKKIGDSDSDDELAELPPMSTAGIDDQQGSSSGVDVFNMNNSNNSNGSINEDDFIAATALRGVRGTGQSNFPPLGSSLANIGNLSNLGTSMNMNIGNLGNLGGDEISSRLQQLQRQQDLLEQQSGMFSSMNNNLNTTTGAFSSGLNGGGSQNVPPMSQQELNRTQALLDMGLLGSLPGLGSGGISGLGGSLGGGVNMNALAGLGGGSQSGGVNMSALTSSLGRRGSLGGTVNMAPLSAGIGVGSQNSGVNMNTLTSSLGGGSQGGLSQSLGLNMGGGGGMNMNPLGLGNSGLNNSVGLGGNNAGLGGGSNGLTNSQMLAALRNSGGGGSSLLYGLGGGNAGKFMLKIWILMNGPLVVYSACLVKARILANNVPIVFPLCRQTTYSNRCHSWPRSARAELVRAALI